MSELKQNLFPNREMYQLEKWNRKFTKRLLMLNWNETRKRLRKIRKSK